MGKGIEVKIFKNERPLEIPNTSHIAFEITENGFFRGFCKGDQFFYGGQEPLSEEELKEVKNQIGSLMQQAYRDYYGA